MSIQGIRASRSLSFLPSFLLSLSFRLALVVICLGSVLRIAPPEFGIDSEANFHFLQRKVNCWPDFASLCLPWNGIRMRCWNCPLCSAPLVSDCSHKNRSLQLAKQSGGGSHLSLSPNTVRISTQSQQASLHGVIESLSLSPEPTLVRRILWQNYFQVPALSNDQAPGISKGNPITCMAKDDKDTTRVTERKKYYSITPDICSPNQCIFLRPSGRECGQFHTSISVIEHAFKCIPAW